MPQPTPYVRSYSFTDFQTSNPTTPLPGNNVDSQLNSIQQTFTQTLANLALIQRDDGALANGSVGSDQLQAGLVIGINSITDWATGTIYIVTDAVWQLGVLYRCLIDHTSGTFTTDLAAGKWGVVFDAVVNLQPYIDTLTQEATDALVLIEADTAAAAASATAAAASATAAASSATSAASSASAASTSASAASTSASTASTQATNAATSASGASTSATAAAASATAAAASATAAATSATAAALAVVVTTVAESATPAVDLSLGRSFTYTTGANTPTFTFTNPDATAKNCSFELLLTQGGTGRTITWPTTKWSNGIVPTTNVASTIYWLVFKTYNGGTTWYGFLEGEAMA